MRLLAMICVSVAVISSIYYLTTLKQIDTDSDYRFEIIEGKRIATADKNIYVLKINEDPEAAPILYIRSSSGWDLMLNEGLRVSNVLKCFNGIVYAAGVDVVKIRNGKIDWIKDLVTKRLGYEGTRENPIPVYYEDVLNVFDIESDGTYLYINARESIAKTDEDLNVIWAVELLRKDGNRFGDLNDDIAVSDGIYATRGNHIIKLNKGGELEWAVGLKSDEIIKKKLEIPEEKREAAEREGKKVPEFYEISRYSVELYAIYADENYVYVAGLVNERLSEAYEKDFPFVAKLSSDGKLLWAEIVNVTYPAHGTYVLKGKIIRDGNRFIGWVSNCILFTFDDNGRILNFYILREDIEDVALMNGTVYIATLSTQIEKKEVKMEKVSAVSIPVSVKAIKEELNVKEGRMLP